MAGSGANDQHSVPVRVRLEKVFCIGVGSLKTNLPDIFSKSRHFGTSCFNHLNKREALGQADRRYQVLDYVHMFLMLKNNLF